MTVVACAPEKWWHVGTSWVHRYFRGFMEFRINQLSHYNLHLPVSSTFLFPNRKGLSQPNYPLPSSTNSYLLSLSFQNVKSQSIHFSLFKGLKKKTFKGKKKLPKYIKNCKYQIYFYKTRLKILAWTILWDQYPHFKNKITTKDTLTKAKIHPTKSCVIQMFTQWDTEMQTKI